MWKNDTSGFEPQRNAEASSTYGGQIRGVWITELVLLLVHLLVFGVLVIQVPVVIVIVLCVGFWFFLAFWTSLLYYSEQTKNVHGLIAWYIFYAFYVGVTIFTLIFNAGARYGTPVYTIIIAIIFLLYRIYAIHVVRSRAIEIIQGFHHPTTTV